MPDRRKEHTTRSTAYRYRYRAYQNRYGSTKIGTERTKIGTEARSRRRPKADESPEPPFSQILKILRGFSEIGNGRTRTLVSR